LIDQATEITFDAAWCLGPEAERDDGTIWA